MQMYLLTHCGQLGIHCDDTQIHTIMMKIGGHLMNFRYSYTRSVRRSN